jgi:hypothetical protein
MEAFMNRKSIKGILVGLWFFLVWGFALMTALAQKPPTSINLDAKVENFLDYIQGLPNYQTTIHRSGGSGLSISCKK